MRDGSVLARHIDKVNSQDRDLTGPHLVWLRHRHPHGFGRKNSEAERKTGEREYLTPPFPRAFYADLSPPTTKKNNLKTWFLNGLTCFRHVSRINDLWFTLRDRRIGTPSPQIPDVPEAVLIEVEHLTKSYGQARAVNDISFKVEKGEILGFLGPNGAGKTTTMRILTGYLPATSGAARVAGFDVSEQSLEVRKRIGYLPETPPLYPDMTVRAYLEFVARIKAVPNNEIAKRVDEAMKMTNIADRANEFIKRLSRGYKQRVGIAQAIVHNPDVVILDEPTVGLDPKQIIEVRKLIKGLKKDHTVILSTHILPEVSMTCDRVVIINKGRIVAVDTPENLTTQLKGGERVHLEVRGEIEKLRSTLAEIEGIKQINVEEREGSATISAPIAATVESEQGLDLRGQIAAKIVGGGLELLELRGVNLSLEEIFLQLTTEEQAAQRAEETPEPPPAEVSSGEVSSGEVSS
jgi:ABC-2 type transport system ATP-binding protein